MEANKDAHLPMGNVLDIYNWSCHAGGYGIEKHNSHL